MKSKKKHHKKPRNSISEVSSPPAIIKDKFLPESDSIVKSIIEKLISLTISKSIKNRIEKEIPNKCFNFIKDILKHKLEIEFLSHDVDDSQNGKNPNELSILTNKFGVLNNSSDKDSENKSNSFIIKKINENDIINNSNNNNTILYNEEQIFYNNSCKGENDWDIMNEPKSSKYDRYSVSLIKFKEIERQEDKIINKIKKGMKINELEEVKEEESLSNANKEKENQKNKRDSLFMNTIDISKNINRKSIISINKLNTSQQSQPQGIRKRVIVDINQFPYEDINDDDEYHEENDNIDYDKLRKELIELEEAKLKEEARRKKKNKVFDIKDIIGENSKQYYGRNVTVDPNGKIVLIKRINIDRLKKDFTTAKTTLKHVKQKKVKKNENKEKENNEENVNNIIMNKDKETIDADKKSEISNLIDQFKTINSKGTENKTLPKIGNKRGSLSNNEAKSENTETRRNKKESIIPSGSNFNIINMEIGVSIKEDEKFKTGGKDFFKKFNKYSKEIYDKKLKESIEANSFLKLPIEENNFKTEPNFDDKGKEDTNSKYLMTSTNNFVNSNYLSNLIGSYNINNFNNKNDFMTKTHTSYMNNNHSNILNPSIKLSNASSLVGSINKLSLISENEERLAKKNTNLFKRKNLKRFFLNNFNEMNQFTKEILKTSDWSTRTANKSEGKYINGYAKPYTKPNIFELNREMGYGNRSIRSRSKAIPNLINPALQTVAFFKH